MINEIKNDQGMVRIYGEFSAGAYLIASSEPSAAIVTSNLTPNKGAGEIDEPTMNIRTLRSEGDQSARRGPMGPRSKSGKQRSSRNAIKFGLFCQSYFAQR
jgi:hypothetical protein